MEDKNSRESFSSVIAYLLSEIMKANINIAKTQMLLNEKLSLDEEASVEINKLIQDNIERTEKLSEHTKKLLQ